MEKTDIIVIGAGAVGLAVADKLCAKGKEVVVVEKHDGFGRETSSRNSEVIHAGLYYKEGSLKADMCVRGNRMLYEHCKSQGVPHKNTGKILVANNEVEVETLHRLADLATRNGAPGIELLTGEHVRELEPHVTAIAGLLSPSTGVVDTHQLMKSLEMGIESNGGMVAYNCEVVGLSKASEGFVVEIKDADGEPMDMACEVVVNSAGLGSDAVAQMAGIDIDEAGYRLHFCKGEYFSVSNRHRGKLTRLVYPPPTAISLGIHAVLGLDGALKLGPNAFYVDKIDYDVDPSHQAEFLAGAREYLPFVEMNDLQPDQSGVRPKLQGPGEGFRDFVICEESGRGLGGLVNLVGIESPGLTSCLAIAEKTVELLG